MKKRFTPFSVAPFRQAESFIDFNEFLSVYDISLLPRTFDTFTLNDNSDDEPYNSDNDSQFSFSSFDDPSLLSSLSESTPPLPVVFSLFYLNPRPLVKISTVLFPDKFSDFNPFSISLFLNFSKFEHHRK